MPPKKLTDEEKEEIFNLWKNENEEYARVEQLW